ncbi:MAG TPA: diglucosylglycerate octanoyltransferase [Pseudonocardiaceae bacterium]|nr:diglucosylglycerate octanoyltransferase [Pseudonocardiaceae bacterium]
MSARLTGPRLLVFADSLAFHGPTGPMPADDPRLWPNLAAARLGGTAHLFAGFGWTARDAWWALAGDPNIWALLPQVDALVLAVGSMDTLPSPLPTYLRTGLRYLRPDPLRRTARKAYLAAQPVLSRLLRGHPVTLPPALTVRYLGDCLHAIRALRPDLPAVAVLPPTHRAPSYGAVHTGHGPATAAIRAWGTRSKVPLLDLTALTGRHVLAGEGNPDGIHWGWAGHEAVGAAFADTLAGLLTVDLPRNVDRPSDDDQLSNGDRPCCRSGPET